MFWFFGFYTLLSGVFALDCQVVSLPGVVPRIADQTPPSTSIDFSSIFTMLAHLTKLYSIFELNSSPENNKTISTDRLAHCLILGSPVPWENLQQYKYENKAVVLQGYFGRSKADDSDNVAEGCLIDNFVFLNQKCGSFSSFAQQGVTFKPYGQINNQVLLPILKDNVIKFINFDDNANGPYVCEATPLSNLISSTKQTLEDVYCTMQDFMSIILPKSNVKGCSSFQLQIAESLVEESIDNRKDALADICANLPKFPCPSRITRDVQFSGKLLHELSNLSMIMLEKALTKISNSLLRNSFPKLNEGLNNALASYPEDTAPFSYSDWVLSLRIISKLSLAKQKHEDRRLQTLVWMMDLKDSLIDVTRTFFERYNLVLHQLSASATNCALHPSKPYFECSSKAMLKNFQNNSFNLLSDKQSFEMGSLYYISCYSSTAFNFKGNRQIFLKKNNTFINENATIPASCLNTHTFSYDNCYHILSSSFKPNLQVGTTELLLADANNNIVLADNQPFTVWLKDNTKLQGDKSYQIEISSFPISIQKGPGKTEFIDSSFVLNRIGYDSIMSFTLAQLNHFKTFATTLNQKENLELILKASPPLSASEIALIVLSGCLLLAGMFKIISKSSCFMKCKFDKPIKSAATTTKTEYIPFQIRPFNKLKKQQFHKIIKTFIETGEWYSHSTLGTVDLELARQIVTAIKESRESCKIFKTHLELRDKGVSLCTARQEFRLALCLAEQLSARLCPCLVPVHVCSDPTPAADFELENISEASGLIASAPEAGT